MRVVAIIQARLGSTRLPSKVLEPLAGAPMLDRVIHRARRAKQIHDVVIATTTNPADDALEVYARRGGNAVFRGSEADVLSRYVGAAKAANATHVVRITSDCPFVDPGLIDLAVERLLHEGADYVATFLPVRTFPRGLDVEVMTAEALYLADREDHDPEFREHVTPFIYNHPERFRIAGITNEERLESHRWTVDTADDLAFARAVYGYFGGDDFSWVDMLAVVKRHPEWTALNAHVEQKITP